MNQNCKEPDVGTESNENQKKFRREERYLALKCYRSY